MKNETIYFKINNNKLNQLIQNSRKNISDIAEEVHVSRNTLHRWRSGKINLIKESNLKNLALTLECKTDDLVKNYEEVRSDKITNQDQFLSEFEKLCFKNRKLELLEYYVVEQLNKNDHFNKRAKFYKILIEIYIRQNKPTKALEIFNDIEPKLASFQNNIERNNFYLLGITITSILGMMIRANQLIQKTEYIEDQDYLTVYYAVLGASYFNFFDQKATEYLNKACCFTNPSHIDYHSIKAYYINSLIYEGENEKVSSLLSEIKEEIDSSSDLSIPNLKSYYYLSVIHHVICNNLKKAKEYFEIFLKYSDQETAVFRHYLSAIMAKKEGQYNKAILYFLELEKQSERNNLRLYILSQLELIDCFKKLGTVENISYHESKIGDKLGTSSNLTNFNHFLI